MKYFEVQFYAHHKSLNNKYAKIKMQAKDLERLIAQINKRIIQLNRLPNPTSHEPWILSDIKELDGVESKS